MLEKELMEKINDFDKDWVCKILDRYSEDYPHLQKNWEKICKEVVKKETKKIILVNKIPVNKDDKDYEKISLICKELYEKGYIVRRDEEFIGCPVCQMAIPNENLYNKLRDFKNIKDVKLPKYFSIPEYWSEKCVKCQ